MIRRVLTLVIIGMLVWLMVQLEQLPLARGKVEIAFMLGFVLLAAYLVGTIGEQFRLPRITGYIFAGMMFGPYVLGFLDQGVLGRLGVFNDMALAFIGLAAGAELRMNVLRLRAKSVILLILFTASFVLVGVTAVILLVHPIIPAMAGRSGVQVVAMCALLGVVAVARSPSSAIAVINETRARGPFTETILGVAMSMDLLILPLFSVVAALAGIAFVPERAFDFRFILALSGEIVASLVLGVLLGALVASYIKYGGPQKSLVLIGLCFLVYKFSHAFGLYMKEVFDVSIHMEPLLICAAAGFAIQNLSRQGERLLGAMENVSLPVYVVFFTMAGAGLNMSALASGWTAAVVLVGARLAMIWLGCRVATRLAGDPIEFRRYGWMGFVTQAGLSIALATQLATTFGEWGRQLGTMLVAAIAVNQIIGPVAFKFSLERVGETRKMRQAKRQVEAVRGSSSCE